MGNARYDSDTFQDYSRTHRVRERSDAELFSSNVHESMNPKNITVRESRDSPANPQSNAIGIFGDHTGSMGSLAGEMLREGVDRVMHELYERKPVTDPHILFGVFGDLYCDRAPLQVSQFEADIRIVEQLRNAYLEGNGGGNGGESGTLPWYFMATHTSIDCWERRQRKGYIFTYSDEPVHDELPLGPLQALFGDKYVEAPRKAKQLRNLVKEKYHLFHLVVNPHSHQNAIPSWEALLHDHVVALEDHRRMPEVIISLIQMNEGMERERVVQSWDGDVRRIIDRATGNFQPGRAIEL